MISLYTTITIKFFFLFAPFFVISMFLVLTQGESQQAKKKIIHRAMVAALLICLLLFFAGPVLFSVIGITLDSFRIGAGTLLFLTSISLVNNGTRSHAKGLPDEERDDISVVPLAIPVIVGPATIGTVMVYGAELTAPADIMAGLAGLTTALLGLMFSLYSSGLIIRAIGRTGLNVLSKISGLILAAMAAEIIFTGIASFMSKL